MKKVTNFWQALKNKQEPIFALAPMAGVADSPFRLMCKKFGADVLYSEMASATALVYAPEKTLELVKFDKKERPYVVQLFGSKPEHFVIATKLITKKIKPDGIDINFGCPVKKVQKQGAGAILMTDLKLSRDIIKSVIDNTNLPVSIKIRARSGEIDALQFLQTVNDLKISAVMIHGRSMSQGHTGEVDWQIIKEARKYFSGVILANGGIMDKKSADEMLMKTGVDGLGIARGALGKPWLFDEVKGSKLKVKSQKQIFSLMIKHAKLAENIMGGRGIIEMRKHLCWYVAGIPGAAELRQKLIQVKSLKEIKEVLSPRA